MEESVTRVEGVVASGAVLRAVVEERLIPAVLDDTQVKRRGVVHVDSEHERAVVTPGSRVAYARAKGAQSSEAPRVRVAAVRPRAGHKRTQRLHVPVHEKRGAETSGTLGRQKLESGVGDGRRVTSGVNVAP